MFFLAAQNLRVFVVVVVVVVVPSCLNGVHSFPSVLEHEWTVLFLYVSLFEFICKHACFSVGF